jgi:hypothetical protein
MMIKQEVGGDGCLFLSSNNQASLTDPAKLAGCEIKPGLVLLSNLSYFVPVLTGLFARSVLFDLG